MLRFFFALTLSACSVSDGRTPEVELDITIRQEYYVLAEEYRDLSVVALRPMHPDVRYGSKDRLAAYLLGAYAQSVAALCTSAKVVTLQNELLNSMVEPDLLYTAFTLDRSCRLALELLSIELGISGEPLRRMADRH